jgi:hypothetical protein
MEMELYQTTGLTTGLTTGFTEEFFFTYFTPYCTIVFFFIDRFRQLADSGLVHGKQFRVGFGPCWTHHTRLLEGALLSLVNIEQEKDSQDIDSIQSWLQVGANTTVSPRSVVLIKAIDNVSVQ